MTTALLVAALVVWIAIGIGIGRANAKADKEFRIWLDRGIHPSLWRKDIDGH